MERKDSNRVRRGKWDDARGPCLGVAERAVASGDQLKVSERGEI